jgi:hypothetical protein
MRQLLRIVVITLWTLAAFWGWILSLYAGFWLLVYGQQRYHWQPLAKLLPEWSAALILVGLFGVGTILVTVGALILGMRGRLPGTSRQDRRPQGFPITHISASD